MGTVPVTGFPSDQWAHRAKQLWQCGENIYLAGLNEDGTHHQTKYLRRKDYLPLGATIHMEGRAFRVHNSTALDGTRKFKNFWLSTFAVQQLSDLICLEHQLSTIEYKPYRERQKRIVYPPRESNRDRLCGIIDTILAEQPKDFEVFLQKLIQQGYEVKRGKHTAAKGKEQKISSADELRERATAATERYHAMGDSIKAAETRLAEIAVPRFASWYPPSIWKAI